MTGSLVNSHNPIRELPHAESAQWLAFRNSRRDLSAPGLPDWWVQGAKRTHEQISQSGFPTTKTEQWKYTSLMPLHAQARTLAMGPVDVEGPQGIHVLTLSKLSAALQASEAPAWATRQELVDLERRFRETMSRRDLGFGADLCRTFVVDPFIVLIPKGLKASAPLKIQWKSLPKGHWSFGLAFIDVGDEAEIAISESYGKGVDAQTIQTVLNIGKSAKVSHLRSQIGDGGVVITSALAQVRADASYHTVQISAGSVLSREDFSVELTEQNANATTDGVFIGKASEVLDHHTNLIHLVGETKSQQLYKGILSDESRGVFNGRVVIAKGAKGANSSQMNKNLLLSKRAQIDTKPQLEIENDDVKAAHGAAIGRLDREHIFYLRSRGISQTEATEMLSRGFAYEVIDRLDSDALKHIGNKALTDILAGLRWEES